MPQFKSNINNESEFIKELDFFIDYFKTQTSSQWMEEANKIVNQISKIVNDKAELIYNQMEFTNTRNVEEWPGGLAFLNSELGIKYINLLHYFAKSYKFKK